MEDILLVVFDECHGDSEPATATAMNEISKRIPAATSTTKLKVFKTLNADDDEGIKLALQYFYKLK